MLLGDVHSGSWCFAKDTVEYLTFPSAEEVHVILTLIEEQPTYNFFMDHSEAPFLWSFNFANVRQTLCMCDIVFQAKVYWKLGMYYILDEATYCWSSVKYFECKAVLQRWKQGHPNIWWVNQEAFQYWPSESSSYCPLLEM
jgi:hypothetical protein